jgi:transposase
MSTKKEIKLLTELLGLEGMRVCSQQQHQGIGIILQIEPMVKESRCHRCGKKSSRLHQNHRYIVKDLSWGEKLVFLEINRRQFKCEKCDRPFSEEIDFVRGRRTYTKRLAKEIIQEVLADDIQSVAKKGVVTAEEIERMLKDAGEELLESKPTELRKLGIDEIALVKGQGKYCAVLVDLEKSKLLTILPSRKQEDIKKVLMEWGVEVLDKIEEVSIDLWKGYKSLVIELMPKAQVVADRFHVMAQINEELDRQRKKDKRAIESKIKQAKTDKEKVNYEQKLAAIKSSKYALLKNEKDLNEDQKNKLVQVKSEINSLKIAHELKEKFREILEKTTDWLVGLFKLRRWLSKAEKFLPDSCGTITRWLEEIIAYFDHRTTSGVVEGINNKIKLIKRSAYGFTNFKNFKTRCLLNWHFNC